MKTITKMQIKTTAHEAFEAFIDPKKIGNFWFSSSSERWQEGKTIRLRYEEYNAEGEIQVIELIQDQKIVFKWGKEHTVSITFNPQEQNSTLVEVVEEGFVVSEEDLIAQLIDNKEGWVFMLTCLKGYLEFGINELRGGLVH